MRMILIIGIMLACVPSAPSLSASMDTPMPSSRSQLLKNILQNNLNIQSVSRRSEEATSVLSRFDCCPSETHFIQLKGGISREGKVVELYRNHRTVQKFYVTSCRPEVKDRPCPMVDEKFQHYSRCVQKYSYVYAFVKDYNMSESYRLDYIRMKSGCSCEVEFTESIATD